MAFQITATIQNDVSDGCISSSNEDEPANIDGQPLGDGKNVDDVGSHNAFNSVILRDVVAELYKGLSSTKLAATILLMNLCTVHGMINKFCDALVTLLHCHLLPTNNCLLVNYHVAKSLTRKLGLDYINIHACLPGCVFFKKELANELQCPKCGSFRYKDEENKAYHVKMLMHFPIIPRLQGIYRIPCILKLMVWHSKNCSLDGLVCHPCDSKAWNHVHSMWPNFAQKPRNVHLGLVADDVNPFKLHRLVWSTWPMLLLNYNLPPWLTTIFFIMLVLLMPVKLSLMSANFDTYISVIARKVDLVVKRSI
jgi:hypothetical protein